MFEASDESQELYQRVARILARDPRYPMDAYVFMIYTLQKTRRMKLRKLRQSGRLERIDPDQVPIFPSEICDVARRLILRRYGLMARTIWAGWNIDATDDLGQILANLVHSGDVQAEDQGEMADFHDRFDFDQALGSDYQIPWNPPGE